ncbi:MAG: M23 family metallopeptidase [Anaerolineae bacterium]
MMRQLTFLTILLLFSIAGGGISQGQTAERPLILPFLDPPGIDTWLLGQAYGNTTGAYRFGDQWYSAGQGLHFGLDFSAPCGTPLVAVADGTVAFVDNLNFGSAPHNVILRHDALNLTSLYGHLLERAPLTEGMQIQQGDLVGYTGDPDSTCESRPHLHLEIRTLDYRTALNPVDYIDANWNSLALIGSFSSRNYQIDLDNARQWQTLDDQPDVAFGGRILNNYSAPYPAEINPPSNPPLVRNTAPIATDNPATLRIFDPTGCCWENWWHPTDANRLYTLDGFQNQRAGIYGYDARNNTLIESLGLAPPPYYSPDFTHAIRPFGNTIEIQNLSSGESWSIETGMAIPSINTDNTRLLWVAQGGTSVPGQSAPTNNILVSDMRGENLQLLVSEAGVNAMWLDAHRLMLTISERPYTRIDIIDVRDNSRYTLGRWYRPRGFSIAPNSERLMFYLAYQPDPEQNGVYWMDITPDAQANRVAWFGAYQWRDADSVFYVPFDATTNTHQLMYYDINSASSRALTDLTRQPFTMMDGRWSVNADGTMILFRNAVDRNLWMIDIATQ